MVDTSREIWEYLPSSPPTRPSSPGQTEALLPMAACAKRAHSLEWACAKARAGRKASRKKPTIPVSRPDAAGDDKDVPMLVLDDPSAENGSVGSNETDTEEEEEAITPNVSTEMLPPLVVSPDADDGEKAPGKDMEAAMALLRFMEPKA